jgi:hypothetical protein
MTAGTLSKIQKRADWGGAGRLWLNPKGKTRPPTTLERASHLGGANHHNRLVTALDDSTFDRRNEVSDCWDGTRPSQRDVYGNSISSHYLQRYAIHSFFARLCLVNALVHAKVLGQECYD